MAMARTAVSGSGSFDAAEAAAALPATPRAESPAASASQWGRRPSSTIFFASGGSDLLAWERLRPPQSLFAQYNHAADTEAEAAEGVDGEADGESGLPVEDGVGATPSLRLPSSVAPAVPLSSTGHSHAVEVAPTDANLGGPESRFRERKPTAMSKLNPRACRAPAGAGAIAVKTSSDDASRPDGVAHTLHPNNRDVADCTTALLRDDNAGIAPDASAQLSRINASATADVESRLRADQSQPTATTAVASTAPPRRSALSGAFVPLAEAAPLAATSPAPPRRTGLSGAFAPLADSAPAASASAAGAPPRRSALSGAFASLADSTAPPSTGAAAQPKRSALSGAFAPLADSPQPPGIASAGAPPRRTALSGAFAPLAESALPPVTTNVAVPPARSALSGAFAPLADGVQPLASATAAPPRRTALIGAFAPLADSAPSSEHAVSAVAAPAAAPPKRIALTGVFAPPTSSHASTNHRTASPRRGANARPAAKSPPAPPSKPPPAGDEFVVLGSDGLFDVFPNRQDLMNVIKQALRGMCRMGGMLAMQFEQNSHLLRSLQRRATLAVRASASLLRRWRNVARTIMCQWR